MEIAYEFQSLFKMAKKKTMDSTGNCELSEGEIDVFHQVSPLHTHMRISKSKLITINLLLFILYIGRN